MNVGLDQAAAAQAALRVIGGRVGDGSDFIFYIFQLNLMAVRDASGPRRHRGEPGAKKMCCPD